MAEETRPRTDGPPGRGPGGDRPRFEGRPGRPPSGAGGGPGGPGGAGPRSGGGPGGGPGGRPQRKRFVRRFHRRKVCRFCVAKDEYIDYKDARRLRRYVSDRGKIMPRRVTGCCAGHQRMLTIAIKRARNIALLPFKAQ